MNKEVRSVIDKINKEYLLMLEKLSSDFCDEKYLRYVINEISLFWSRKRKEVLFIIEYLGNDSYNATFFTGAVSLDVNENEHIPFLLCGEYCIYDDPLPSFLKVLNVEPVLNKLFIEKATNSIKDNIYTLKNCSKTIIILPLRYLLVNEEENKKAADVSNNLFLALFDSNFNSMEDYFNSIKAKQDFLNSINKNVGGNLLFNNDDSLSTPLEERIDNYCKSFNLKTNNYPVAAYQAYFSIILQSVIIFMMAEKTIFTPFIRSRQTVNNFIAIADVLLSNNINKDDFDKTLLIRTLYYSYLYQYFINNGFDENKIAQIDNGSFSNKFYKYLIDNNFKMNSKLVANYIDSAGLKND